MKRCLNGRPLLLTGGTGPWSWQLVLCTFLLALSAPVGWAQQMGPTRVLPPPLRVALDSVAVAPQALDTQGWLLLNPDIQTELDGAVHNLYNFKFNQAERQFRSLRRRYPQHPMPYFLLGLSTWWKIMPSNAANRQYDRVFFAYLDTAIVKAQRLYDTDNQNYEASFFLSAAYGFDARLHAERRDWRKATVSSKRALTYLQKSRAANGLSPEFVFGEGLFNYYAGWIAEEYPWLRPVLLFFPKGDHDRGLAQLTTAARQGFYTGTEARFFRMRILGSERENNTAEALLAARSLAQDFPDNACFARSYATQAFAEGEFDECEKMSRTILAKLNQGLAGYEASSGRVAAYYLGYLLQNRYRDPVQAADYYRRCLVFSETEQLTMGYYVFANAALARLAARQPDVITACRYYAVVVAKAGRHEPQYAEARAYLRQHRASNGRL
jgi:hypothetical protein